MKRCHVDEGVLVLLSLSCVCAGATGQPDEHPQTDPATLRPLHHPQPREEGELN